MYVCIYLYLYISLLLFHLCQGVQHLHDNRLCHFDIKPANIFIAQDGYTCKLGDFGLVVSMDNGK